MTQEVAKYIDKLPTDVTPDDLEKKVNNVLSETIDESVERLCKKYDAENKGYLSASEVKEFLMNLLE